MAGSVVIMTEWDRRLGVVLLQARSAEGLTALFGRTERMVARGEPLSAVGKAVRFLPAGAAAPARRLS